MKDGNEKQIRLLRQALLAAQQAASKIIDAQPVDGTLIKQSAELCYDLAMMIKELEANSEQIPETSV